jgi:ubiquitin-protein ligase
VHNFIKYEFDFRFDVPATYPAVAPEIELPELEGKTAKMYRGGKICLTIHFKPLWAKNRCAAGCRTGITPMVETACAGPYLCVVIEHAA